VALLPNPSPDPSGILRLGDPSAALNLAIGLRNAAAQQKAQKEKDYQTSLQRDFENQRQLETEGFERAQVYANGDPLPGRPTLMTPEDSPAASSKGQRITDTQGREWVKPTEEEKALKGGKSITLDKSDANVINQMLNTKAYKPGQVISAEHHATLLEKAKKSLGDILDDSNSVSITQDMADRLSPHGIAVKPGARISLEKLANLRDLATIAEPKPPAEKPTKAMHVGQSTNDKGDVTFTIIDPETGDLVKTHNVKGAGKTAREPQGDKPKTATPNQFRMADKDKKSALDKVETEYRKALQEAVTPEEKSAAVAMRQEGRLQAQLAYEQQVSDLVGNDVGHNDWAERLAEQENQPAKPQAKPERPAQAPPAAAAPQQAAAPITEGTIIRNPKTGARQILRGGQWQPL